MDKELFAQGVVITDSQDCAAPRVKVLGIKIFWVIPDLLSDSEAIGLVM